MRLILGTVLAVSTLTLSACGKPDNNKVNESVTPDGYCTQLFIDDLDALTTEINRVDNIGSRADTTNLKKSCQNFLSKHGGVVCKAVRANQMAEIHAEGVKFKCDSVP